jgi:uncharacterized OsmC-like protein
MNMKISQVAGHQFKAEYLDVELISGKVKDNSHYEGMSPGSLMVAALGMCTGMHIESYLSKNGVEFEGIEIEIKNRYERNPTRAAEFTLKVKVDGELSDEHRKGLLEEANRCYVGNTIKNAPTITVDLE